MRAVQAQMQGLMAYNNQRAAQQGSYTNWQQPSFNVSAYNPYVSPPLNPYGAPYYNPGMFKGNLPTIQDYSLQPTAIDAPNLQDQGTNRQATHPGNSRKHDHDSHRTKGNRSLSNNTCTSRSYSLRQIKSTMKTMMRAMISLLTSISLLLVIFVCLHQNVYSTFTIIFTVRLYIFIMQTL